MLDIDVVLDEGAKMPVKGHAEDAGFDLFTRNAFTIAPGVRKEIHTGVHMDIPRGYCGLIKSKSGLNRQGIQCEGVIDAGYTGEIVVFMYNHGNEVKTFEAGQKVTQILIAPVPGVYLHETDVLPEYERGNAGFGSTGKFG